MTVRSTLSVLAVAMIGLCIASPAFAQTEGVRRQMIHAAPELRPPIQERTFRDGQAL